MRKLFALILTLLMPFSLMLPVMAEAGKVFGEMQVLDIMNGMKTKVIGERAVVTASKDLMTDDDLIEYYKTQIKDSGYNWFTIDFGDGTGYCFYGSLYWFTYLYQHEEDWSHSDPDQEIGTGYVFDDHVDFKLALKVPELSTIEEYRKWAKQNGVDLRLLDEALKEVKKGKKIVEIWEKIVYPDDTLTMIVK